MIMSAGKKTRSVAATRRLSNAVYHTLMMFFSFVMMYPLFWLIASSFKPNSEIFTDVTSLIPKTFTTEHYINGWRGFAGLTFTVFFKNSLFISVIQSIGCTFSAALSAFGFARIRFKGRQFWFVCMILTMMLPSQVMMIPKYVQYNNWGWVGSYLPLTIPAFVGGSFNIFLVMQFIRGVPREMDEAARIDGCSWVGIFSRIIVPLIVPALTMIAVNTFIGSWGDFMGALLYLNKPDMYPVAMALKVFTDAEQSNFGASFAMSVLSLVPILILFVIFQKSLIEGISTQGLKG